MMMIHAKTHDKLIYIAALYFKDAFGSVTHDILRQKLIRTGIPFHNIGVIMDSYNKLVVRIWN
jgi:hypothetical protein